METGIYQMSRSIRDVFFYTIFNIVFSFSHPPAMKLEQLSAVSRVSGEISKHAMNLSRRN